MYTGFLDLNYTNIYNILLATHILHMPRALEICRSFLIQNHPLEVRPAAANIIKPIPSRKSALPHQQIFTPLFGNLQKSEDTPFRSIGGHEKQTSTKPSTNTEPEVQNKDTPENQDLQEQKRISVSDNKSNKIRKREDGGSNSSEKVVVDVACCDGPVRFHRVLNKNYGLKNLESDFHIEQVDRNVLLNKVMTENIRDKQSENENHTHGDGTNDMFTCVYCNHTFKSQYCYQKHARRHLNPVNLEVKSIQKVENFVSSKREVKLLDMNVQYYPCKTCGSKFPSYYFVHKHRKMCHADETGDGSVKNVDTGEKSNNDSTVESTNDTKNNEESEIEVGNDN
ncbi:hypothetical protein ILUMI_05347 [Ignelater luminosus]|uniref:C2H2-type domain-containing protein n=1 Tax=Ignelater luminosus TaxID=2038154 RepID=A0A8K0GK58_IGNLU|nr:hypothetical protein ILUMI_05347 [Ignelater luminosus]